MAVRQPLLQLVPEPRLALVIAVTSLLWLVPGGAGTIAALVSLGLVIVATVADAIALPTDRDLTIQRTMPATVGIGDAASGEYVVASHWGLPLRVRLSDALPIGITGSARDAELALPSHGTTRFALPILGAVRGRL